MLLLLTSLKSLTSVVIFWIGSLHDQRQHVTTLGATETVVET